MLSLAIHNAARASASQARRERPECAGVLCNKCSEPMVYAGHAQLVAPPAASVRCPACGATGALYL